MPTTQKDLKIMSSTPSAILESYNSITDPSLVNYFSNPQKIRHLKKIGLVDRKGNLRSEAEIEEYNVRLSQKKSYSDLIGKALVFKKSELERKRIWEEKKLKLEEEKRVMVEKARQRQGKPSRRNFTKKLDTTFLYNSAIQNDGEEIQGGEKEDVDETFFEESNDNLTDKNSKTISSVNENNLNNSINANIYFSTAIPQPKYDKVHDLSELLAKNDMISPYLQSVDHHASKNGHVTSQPVNLHKLIMKNQPYDEKMSLRKKKGKKYSSKTSMLSTAEKEMILHSGKAKIYGQYKKPQSIKSVNRLARSNLPGLKELEEKRKREAAEKAALDRSHRMAQEKQYLENAGIQDLNNKINYQRQIIKKISKTNSFKSDITELKALASPPNQVLNSIKILAIILDEKSCKKKSDWSIQKKWLASEDFVNGINFFNKNILSWSEEDVNDPRGKKVVKELENQELNEQVVAKVSKAASNLIAWATAVYKFYSLVLLKEGLGRGRSKSAASSNTAAFESKIETKTRSPLEVSNSNGRVSEPSASSSPRRQKIDSKNSSRPTTHASQRELQPSPPSNNSNSESSKSSSSSNSASSVKSNDQDHQVKIQSRASSEAYFG